MEPNLTQPSNQPAPTSAQPVQPSPQVEQAVQSEAPMPMEQPVQVQTSPAPEPSSTPMEQQSVVPSESTTQSQNVQASQQGAPLGQAGQTNSAATSTHDAGHGLAIGSLVTSILGFGLIGLILGIMSGKKSKQSGHKRSGLATAGIAIGVINILVSLAVIPLAYMSYLYTTEELDNISDDIDSSLIIEDSNE